MAAPGQSWPPFELHPDHNDLQESPTPTKRARVTIACQRCKTRKQKCDGNHPCAKCHASNHFCEYNIPQRPMPFGKDHYIKALERRVADLEKLLSVHGIADVSTDHWNVSTSSITAATTSPTSLAGSPPGVKTKRDSLQDDILEWQDGMDSISSVLRSLSLDVNGSGYVGASSQIALGRLFGFINGGHGQSFIDTVQQYDHGNAPGVCSSADEATEFADMSEDIATRLFSGYLKHIATRWPIVHSVWARELHNNRRCILDGFESTILHLVYATAGRFLETTGESRDFHVKGHYHAAMRSIDTILALNDVRSVQALMLMAVYCLRDPVGAGAWTYNKTALLIAIDHGMHRRLKSTDSLSMANELRKRLFWACYSFDRQISIPMGRPFGISDRDIDIGLPLDIDEDTTDEQLSEYRGRLGSPHKSTSMTLFNMVVQLRRIESDIQQTIYRVDEGSSISDAIVEEFLLRLDSWAARIPSDTRQVRDRDGVPFDGYDHYMVYYYKCRRLLLFPQITKKDVQPKFLKECARACVGVCGAYKRLHQALAVGYSLMALQTVFMAGLTLVYCLWISPHDIFDATTSKGIHDCSIVLFVIAERIPAAKKYRNAFEVIRQRVMDRIAETGIGEDRSRESVPGLTADLAASGCYPIHLNFHYGSDLNFGVEEEALSHFSYILTDMAGNHGPGSFNSVNNNTMPPGVSDGTSYVAHDHSRPFGNADPKQAHLTLATEPSTYAADCLDPFRPSFGTEYR